MSRVLIISDIHEPFAHPKSLKFCKDVARKYRTNKTVFIGDVVDLHALARWDADPEGYSPGHEIDKARKCVAKWVKAFPEADVCIGNHDERVYRKAMACGIPSSLLRDYAEVWQTPGWNWDLQHIIDDVQYVHGTGTSGKYAALNRAIATRMSTVMGHTHTFPGIQFHANERDCIFGMNVGCLIDVKAYSMAYGKHFVTRPTLGCGVVIDGHPYFELMDLNRKYKR